MSKRTELAKLCREQRDQAHKIATGGNVQWEAARVLTKCAVLLGCLAIVFDEDDGLQNTTLYRRDRNRFVKVEK